MNLLKYAAPVLALAVSAARPNEPPADWTKVVNLSVRVDPRDASDKSWDIDYSPGGGIGPLVIFGNGVHSAAPDLILCIADEHAHSYCFEHSTDPNSKPEAYAPNAFALSL